MNRSYVLSATDWLHKKTIIFLITLFVACPLIPTIARAQDDVASDKLAVNDSSEAIPSAPVVASGSAEGDRTPDASPGMAEADPGIPQSNTSGPGATKDPEISWKHFPKRVIEDQKDLWLFPTQLARGRHWIPTLAIAGVTGVLIATDPHTQPYFRDNKGFEETSEIFSTTNTGIVEVGVPVTTYAVGLLRHDSYTQQTALLAGEAYVDSTIAQVVIQLVSLRLRPRDVASDHDFRDTFFRNSAANVFTKGTSFPSGHATAGFAIATVMARRYGTHKWVPWVAYGVAGLISISRVPDMAHFPSDVFLGAALGYTITRYDVFRSNR